MFIKCGVEPLRRVCWYDPSPGDALDQMLRAACNVGPGEDYLLCDADCTPVAVSSSLPSDLTFELVRAAIASALLPAPWPPTRPSFRLLCAGAVGAPASGLAV